MNTTEEIATIIDKGRGPQLSNRKLTVQDLLPFFKAGKPDAEILRWYPQIGQMELDLLRQYYLEHTDDVLALEREIEADNVELRKKYPRPPSELDALPPEEWAEYLKKKLALRQAKECNGVPHSSR